ncbi:hypothetical protein KXD93_04495 [Mucilaginibacter sp. BJC16-A38]|uniref:hypothetical protein n=1 Tax=Mucilaginibacter phenanthrenivorans TaxID=1234842 RepID=UPI0021588744|nr:hypothetical protein [Mucilaginibacter phenanthrenivorans]MCR8556884.1 hypothetical protein [Mucilaginibacter phenanthrenivorans]
MKTTAFSIFILLLAFGCSNKHQIKESDKIVVDTSFLSDENFNYKNIANTNQVSFLRATAKGGGIDSVMYADSSQKQRYKPLSANQRGYFLAPFLPKDYGVKYAKDIMYAWFVSKQNKIGNFQPIILQVEGNDYESLSLILLDENYKPVSELNLDEENILPEHRDNLNLIYNLKSYSILNKNVITSYRITEIRYKDSTERSIVVDSNVFKSIINKDGTISTKQMEKIKSRLSK